MRLLSVTRIIGAPIGDVWALTSAFGAIGLWAAGISRVSLVGAGIGAVRDCTTEYGNAVEQLTLIDADRHRLRYSVSSPGMEAIQGLVGGTELTEVGPEQTRIEWIVEAVSLAGNVSPLIVALRAFIEASIAGLARTLNAAAER